MRRASDAILAALVLAVMTPVLALVAMAIKLDSPGPAFFKQVRIGRGFHPFTIYKFRSMVTEAPDKGGEITTSGDPRVTRVGRWLRRFKLDELPQLWNVVRGDMSLVGPRPEVPKYVEMFRAEYREVLSLRPGITDPASIEFVHEEQMLAEAVNVERMYISVILPRKLELSRQWMRERSISRDLQIIFQTLARLA